MARSTQHEELLAGVKGRIEFSALLISILAAFVLGLRMIHSPDLGFHLRVGEWILENARVPGPEVLAFTAGPARYIDLYWMYQVGQALLERVGGVSLIVLFNATLIAAALAITALRTLERAPRMLFAMPLLLLLGIVAFTYETRPHVISWVFLSIVLLILERHSRGVPAPLWSVPLIIVIWVNTHPLAVLGIVAILVFLAGGVLERRQLDKALLRMALFSCAAFLVTPYLLEGLTVPLQQFGMLQEDSAFKVAIGEYGTPFTLYEYRRGGQPFFLQSLFPLHVYTVLGAIAGILCLARRSWTSLLLVLAFFFVFSLAIKNYEYFFLATFPITLHQLQHSRTPENKGRRRWKHEARGNILTPLVTNSRLQNTLAGLAAFLAIATILAAATNAWYVIWKAPFQTGLALDPLHVPYRASAFIKAHNLDGRIINDITSGGWLLRDLRGQVFIDGRNEVYSEKFLRTVLQTYIAPQALEGLISTHNPQIAIFDYRKTPQWLQYFGSQGQWRLAYADDHSTIWLRKGYADSIPAATMPMGFDADLDEQLTAEIINKEYPRGALAFLTGFYQRQYYPWSELQASTLAYQMGWLQPARRIAFQGLERATVPSPPLFFNLGSILFELSDHQSAKAAYRRFLEYDNDPVARQRISAIERMP